MAARKSLLSDLILWKNQARSECHLYLELCVCVCLKKLGNTVCVSLSLKKYDPYYVVVSKVSAPRVVVK